jgi:hypothetical protein
MPGRSPRDPSSNGTGLAPGPGEAAGGAPGGAVPFPDPDPKGAVTGSAAMGASKRDSWRRKAAIPVRGLAILASGFICA